MTAGVRFGHIRRHGNRQTPFVRTEDGGIEIVRDMRTVGNEIMCRDGFSFSAIAGFGTYCWPRPDFGSTPETYSGPFTHVEVGFWGMRMPKPWKTWRLYLEAPARNVAETTVFAYVPVSVVYDLIKLHGGEIPWQGQRPINVERCLMYNRRRIAQMRRWSSYMRTMEPAATREPALTGDE